MPERPNGIPWLYYEEELDFDSTLKVFRGDHNRLRFVLVVTALNGETLAIEDLGTQWQVWPTVRRAHRHTRAHSSAPQQETHSHMQPRTRFSLSLSLSHCVNHRLTLSHSLTHTHTQIHTARLLGGRQQRMALHRQLVSDGEMHLYFCRVPRR